MLKYPLVVTYSTINSRCERSISN